ncbi:cytochrome b/b6 domain-containing protein [Thiohalorhabdus sp. Cl-TMA]|uniref:Cytochrome b/b6 domain-containing protein n=1 Tax=Thiohalorhabdus methylotrophus TaxID=3242694 RepID=A0ABV4TR28_9GAMM
MSSAEQRTAVWDAPLRLFHWALVGLIGFSWWSGEQGLGWMSAHMLAGQAILALVAFRVLWGLLGTRHARFADFLAGPRRVLVDLRGLLRGRPEPHTGHGPVGGWMVVAILALVALQASSGLFASDDIFTEGPLAGRVSGETSDFLTWAHHVLFDALLWVVGLHVAAVVLFYPLVARTNLIAPMITGRKRLSAPSGSAGGFGWRVGVRALILLGLCAAAVYGGVSWAG